MQRTISGSFRLRLMALVMLGILPPLLGGTWYATYRASKIFRADAQQSMTIKAAALGEHINQWHEQNLQVLDDLRAGTDFSTMERDEQLPTMLSTVQARKADVDLVATVDLDGEIVADVSARPRLHKNYRNQDWFQAAVAGDNSQAQATVIPRQGEPTVLFSKAILSQPTLRVGDRSNTVAQLQTRLQNLGYYSGPVDGIYEGATVEAIRQFKQAFNQKSATGESVGDQVDAITWQTIELAEQAKTKDIAPITAEFTRTASRLDILQSDTAEVEGVVMMEAQLDSIAEVVGKVNVGPGGVALVMDETGQVIAHSSKLPKALKEPTTTPPSLPTDTPPTNEQLAQGIATEKLKSNSHKPIRTIAASRQARAKSARMAKLGQKPPIGPHSPTVQTANAAANTAAPSSQGTAMADPSSQTNPSHRPNHRPTAPVATASTLPLGQENLAKAGHSLTQHINRLNTPSPASPIALASKQPVALASLPNLSNFPPVAALIRGNSGPLTFEDQGQSWMAHGEKLANGWSVLLLVPNEDFSKEARGFRHLSINTAAIALLVTAAATGVLSAKLSHPINRLSAAATALSQGELNQKIDIKSKDQIGTIATAFNSVADQLQVSFAQLADQNESLKRLDQLKDQFLANTSHELKTPLNGMIGIAESLLDGAAGNLTDLQKQNIAMIASSSHRLTRLVNDILDFSKLQHQQLALHRKALGIRASVDVVLALSRSLMQNPSIKLINKIPAALPLVYADENRLQQILLNLVSNAIKFTEKGTITVSAELVTDELAATEPTHMAIAIHDTGIGIAGDRLENIFEPFQQVENSARSYGGTGLGLSITRNLLSLHGGNIWAESTDSQGSTFTFTLPLATETSSQALATEDLATEDLKAEDLKAETPETETPETETPETETTEETSKKTTEAHPSPQKTGNKTGERFAQVVRPITQNLPQMRSLRQRAKLSKTLEKVFHPTKATESKTNTATRIEKAAVEKAPLEKAAAQISVGKFNILVVDDEPINVQVLKNHLSLENYTVTQALNGEEALALINASQRHNQKFDLVVLDVMMPRMSGYEVCAKLRESHPAHELPVVMLTAKNQVSDLITGFQFGANDYMTKPFSKGELLTRIQSHLRLSKTSHSYGRFVPSEYLRFLEKESIVDVRLGDHVSKEMAVMFSDIRSFTTLSESMSPQENFDFVNAYLRQVSPVIRNHEGFIVKYLGDGMMAVFPQGADDAIAAGIAKLRSVAAYNLRRQAQGFAPVKVGIGVHFGHMMVGMVGESARMQGDAFSDNVNLTARIESLTKLYGVSMVISDRALELLTDPEQYNIRFLDRVIVKGRSEPIDLYHVLDGESDDKISQLEQSQPLFSQGIAHYQAGEFQSAKACFSSVLQQHGEGQTTDKAAQLYCDRLEQLLKTPPKNWTGVWKLAQK